MENLITILTICSRPKNISKLYKSIIEQKYSNFKWIISFDSNDLPDIKIKDERIKILKYKNTKDDVTNYAALNNIFDKTLIKPESFICVLDDDNIMYSNYLNVMNDTINSNKDIKFIMYYQNFADGNLRFNIKTKNIKERHIDMAQVCYKNELIEDTRFVQRYTGDGVFYETLFNKVKTNKNEWVILHTSLCYYNYLTDNSKQESIKNSKKK